MSIYNFYAMQTNKHKPHFAGNDPTEGYILARLDRNRMILYQNSLDKVVKAAADQTADTALELIKSVISR